MRRFAWIVSAIIPVWYVSFLTPRFPWHNHTPLPISCLEAPQIFTLRQADLDILVNAAGISQSALLTLTPIEKIQQIISTNLTATIALCKMFDRLNFRRNRLASARNKGRGSRSIQHDPNSVDIGKDSPGNAVGSPTPPGIGQGYSPCIINISSLLGIKGGAGATAYAASKAGVIGFTRALVCEHQLTSTSVRVNAIVPGYIDTPMTQGECVQTPALSMRYSRLAPLSLSHSSCGPPSRDHSTSLSVTLPLSSNPYTSSRQDAQSGTFIQHNSRRPNQAIYLPPSPQCILLSPFPLLAHLGKTPPA